MVRDRSPGTYRRTRLFVLTLGCSRKSVRLLVWRSSAQIWAELHGGGRVREFPHPEIVNDQEWDRGQIREIGFAGTVQRGVGDLLEEHVRSR